MDNELAKDYHFPVFDCSFTIGHGNVLNTFNINSICDHFNVHYLGAFALKNKEGQWTEEPFDCFFQPNPDYDAGHSHFFTVFQRLDMTVMIANAISAFEIPFTGLIENDRFIYSRYRHEFVSYGSVFVDGGRDYFRRGGDGNLMPARLTFYPRADKLLSEMSYKDNKEVIEVF